MKLSKRLRKWKANLTTQTPIDYVITLRADVNGFADEVKALEMENAKLRELVRHMHMCTEHIEGFGVYYDCDNCVLDGTRECDFSQRMRELGIEVE